MSLTRVQIPSPNHSSRSGAGVRLIVLHTAEGARTFQDLGHFFANSSVQASSHCGADDTPNTVGQYVADSEKAWAVADFNSVSVNLELCAFAAWSRDEWLKHPNMLHNAAAWVAEEAQRFGLPIVKLTAAQAQGNGRGVCQHVDLGAAGGGHHDCGPGFPIDEVLSMAQNIAAGAQYSRFDDKPRRIYGKLRTERGQVQLYDKLRAMQTPKLHPRRIQLRFVRLVLVNFCNRIRTLGHLDKFDRQWRLDQMQARAQGKRIV